MTLLDTIAQFLQSIADWAIQAQHRRTKQMMGLPPTSEDRTVANQTVASIVGQAVHYRLPSMPISPAAFWARQKPEADAVNASHVAATIALVAAETVSAGQVDYSLVEFMNLPWMQAMRDMSRETWTSEFRYAGTHLLQRHWQNIYRPVIPEEYRLAEQAAKGLIPLETYFTAMGEQGYTEEWANRWYGSQLQYPTFTQLLNLLWRGEISETIFRSWLQLQGFPSNVQTQLLKLQERIPPLDDLIRMAVREAFPVGAGQPQFDAMRDWAAKQGLSSWWVDRYWLAHFSRMDLAQAYSNLWRGHFTEADFEHYLLLADVHPDDWEHIKRVAFRPQTIREIGYGFDMGLINKADIVRYRRMGGLSAEDAEKASEALIQYRVAAEKEAVRREYLWHFAHENITEAQFRTMLENLETPEEALELWIWRGQLQIQRYNLPDIIEDYRIVTSSEALWAFKNGLRDEAWLRQKLAALFWTEERVNLSIERAKAEMAGVVPEEDAITYRELGSAQLRTLYEEGKIDAEGLIARFKALRYRDDDAELLAQIIIETHARTIIPKLLTRADISRLYDMHVIGLEQVTAEYTRMGYPEAYAEGLAVATAISIELPDLRSRYRNGWITEEELLGRLVYLGLEDERAIEFAETIIKAEQPARVAPERDLTKSEIVKGVKNEILTWEQGVELLMSIGYEEWEAEYILAVNLIVVAGDPDSYGQMRRAVERYRRAMGLTWKEVPEEIDMLEKHIRELEAEIKTLPESEKYAEKLAEKNVELGDAKARLKKVLGRTGLA